MSTPAGPDFQFGDIDWEALCLACDPFEGDYGGNGQNDRVLRDRMVTCKVRTRQCFTCASMIERGERIRIRAEIYDGEFMHWQWCEPCCRAMARVTFPDPATGWDESYQSRIMLGHERRGGGPYFEASEGLMRWGPA